MSENGGENEIRLNLNEEDEPDPMTLELERLNTVLATTENSLREMENERNKERLLREKYERGVVMLKGDVNRADRRSAELERRLAGKDAEIAKADEKRRMEVKRADGMRAELDTLRRATAVLEAQVKAADAAVLDATMNGPRSEPEK